MYDYGIEDLENEIWDIISNSDDDRVVIFLDSDSYEEPGSVRSDSDEMFFMSSSLIPSGCNVQGRPYMYRQVNGTDHRYQTLLLVVSNSSGDYTDLLYELQEDLTNKGYESWLRKDGTILSFELQ